MMYYDHALVAATLTVAIGADRRYGWPIVVMASLAGMVPDWDALAQYHSPRAYQIAHRVWGHNVFAVTLAGAALGAVGYVIHRSKRRPLTQESLESSQGGLAAWMVLGTLIAWSHPLFDLLYCGVDLDADWPVALLWPVVPERVGVPWIQWSDRGATGILLIGLLLLVFRRYRQVAACGSLLVLGLYVGIRGWWVHR